MVSHLRASSTGTDWGCKIGSERALLRRNIVRNNRIAAHYDRLHPEIFTEIEQQRLRETLSRAASGIQSDGREALDFGCGSGNLTAHLVALGFHTTAADVATKFLSIVENRWRGSNDVTTVRLNGQDLGGMADERFDLVATYSVLHHVPDYLAALSELERVLKPGGVLYVDHELTERFWTNDCAYRSFIAEAVPDPPPRTKRFTRFLKPRNYLNKARELHHRWVTSSGDQGDIHVSPDDHIEWAQVLSLLAAKNLVPLFDEEYLLYRAYYPVPIYERYRDRCSDIRVLAAMKPTATVPATGQNRIW
jgi:ubiquinone/menaquinone biosynthesis C-methylase UbiE